MTQKNEPFYQWLREQKITMTANEWIDCIHAARRRGQSVEELLGYPKAKARGNVLTKRLY